MESNQGDLEGGNYRNFSFYGWDEEWGTVNDIDRKRTTITLLC